MDGGQMQPAASRQVNAVGTTPAGFAGSMQSPSVAVSAGQQQISCIKDDYSLILQFPHRIQYLAGRD